MKINEQFNSLPKQSRLRLLRREVKRLRDRADKLADQRDAVLRTAEQTLKIIAVLENEPAPAPVVHEVPGGVVMLVDVDPED